MVATGEPFVAGTSQSESPSSTASENQPSPAQLISELLTEEEERDNYLWGV